MRERKYINSGSVFEKEVAYSRAIRVGNVVEVAGTTAFNNNGVVGEGDMYAQSIFILEKIEHALLEAGAKLSDVVRTRMYVTDISRWKEVGKAHAEKFKDIKPVATMVEVKGLIDKRLWIEIEVTAIVN